MPWVDPPLSVSLDLFYEFTDDNLTGNHLKNFQEILDTTNNPFEEWIEYLVQLGNFEQRIDIHSAYHVMSGDCTILLYNLKRFTHMGTKVNLMISNLWLRDYINATLSSTEYVSKFGEIPYLVGSEYMGQIHNFGLNRRSFAEFCLNKYRL